MSAPVRSLIMEMDGVPTAEAWPSKRNWSLILDKTTGTLYRLCGGVPTALGGGEGTPGPQGRGADIKCGVVNLTAGGSSNVVFAAAFSSVPIVTVTAQFNVSDTSCTICAHSITANGFTVRGAGNPAGSYGWIATNAGNS